MSYECVNELPPQVRKAFSYEDASLWMHYYNDDIVIMNELELDEAVDRAYLTAWEAMRNKTSSRSFTAQVVVEDEDVQGETPIVSEYTKLALTDMIRDGGIGIDKHSSRNVWTIWDVKEAVDSKGRPSIVIQGNFFRDKPMFDVAWDLFLKGRSQFSLGSYTSRNRVCDRNYKCIVEVLPEQWFEISIVDVGASPNTGIIDIHVPDGEGMFNPKNIIEGTKISLKDAESFCPMDYAYHGMKADLEEFMGPSAPDSWELVWVDGFGIIFSGRDIELDEYMPIIENWSEGMFSPSVPVHSNNLGEITIFMIPYSYFTPLDEMGIAALIIDEEEAIAQYDVAIESAKRLGGVEAEGVVNALTHIRDEEAEHIDELYEIVERFYMPLVLDEPSEIDDYPDGITLKSDRGDMTSVRNCPAGQHSHQGIVGCHDVTRAHSFEQGASPEGKIDMTDENIDINAIKNVDTPRLSQVVKAVAKALTSFSDEKVRQFMESSGGKEFTLMITELVNRKRESKGSDNVKEETEIKKEVSEKMDNDPASENAALITVMADIKSTLEHLTTMFMDLKNSNMAGQSQSGNIADAVTTAVDSITNTDGVDLGETSVGNADGTSVVTGSSDAEVAPGVVGEAEGEAPAEGVIPEGKEKGESEGDKPDFGATDKPEEDESKKDDESEGESEGEAEGESEEESEGEPAKEKPKEEDEESKKKTKEAAAFDEGVPDITEGDGEGEDEVDEATKKVSEKADPIAIPTVPCEPVGVRDGTPNIGGEGVVLGGVPSGVDSLGTPLPMDKMVTTKEGVSIENVLPVKIDKGPLGTKLEEIGATKPTASYEATSETGLEGWVAISKSFTEKGILMKVENTPMETKISLKSTDAGVVFIPPAEVNEGTGLKLDKPSGGQREYEKLWSAVGSDNKTFLKIKNEVLQ